MSCALKEENEKSRSAIAKLVDDAEAMLEDKAINKRDMDSKMSAAQLAIKRERDRTLSML